MEMPHITPGVYENFHDEAPMCYCFHVDYRSARLDLGPCPHNGISFAINERGFTDFADD